MFEDIICGKSYIYRPLHYALYLFLEYAHPAFLTTYKEVFVINCIALDLQFSSNKRCGSKSVYFQRTASIWRYTDLLPHPLRQNKKKTKDKRHTPRKKDSWQKEKEDRQTKRKKQTDK